jgi:hypothetical protein
MSRLQTLFDLVQSAACDRRSATPGFDGRGFWQPIKDLLPAETTAPHGWRPLDRNRITSWMALPEKRADGSTIEINHFLIQQVRIPTTEEPSIRKIIQLALNIGQYSGLCTAYERLEYRATGMDQLTTYVSREDIAWLDQQIGDDLVQEVKKHL